MPVFSDYNNLSSYSSAYYYSPYSLSARMSNALYSSPVVPSPSSSSLYSSPTSTTRGYYHPARPISIDTANIDVSSSQLPLRKTNTPTTASYGTIHRGRTVVRLKMSNMKDNPALLRQKSPGRRLVEKFTIPDKSSNAKEPVKIASSAPIRRHISTNRRKPSLITEDGILIPASRKSSVTDELLKEEAAIFDSLIMEEIARTNGVPDRRNSFDCLQTSSIKPKKKSNKRHSVDFSEMNGGVRCSESLCNFIEKLNAQVARSPSVDESVPEVSVTKAASDKDKDLKSAVISSEAPKEDSNSLGKKLNYDVIIEESPERSPETTVTFVLKKPEKKQDTARVGVEESQNLNKQTGKKVKLKKKACETLSEQITLNKKILKDTKLDEPVKKPAPKTEPKKLEQPKSIVTKLEITKSKTSPAIAPQSVQRKELEQPKFPQKIELNKSSSVALISDIPAQVTIDPPKPVRVIELSKSSKALIDSNESVPKVEPAKIKLPAQPKKVIEKVAVKTVPKNDLQKSATDVTLAKKSPNKSNAQVKLVKKKISDKDANANAPEEAAQIATKVVKKSTKKKISKKSIKLSTKSTDKNNNKISKKKSAPKVTDDVTPAQNGISETTTDESQPVSPKRRRSINWKMVDVGKSDFEEEEEIAEINGWFPTEESESEESSEEDSDEETDSDEDSDDCDVNCHKKCEKLMPNLCGVNQKLIVEALAALKKDSGSSSVSPSRNSSNQELNLESISLDGNSSSGTPRRPYSYRHKIVHDFEGRIVAPASTIPRFKKYTVYDFNFLKVLGKGSFGKVLLAELKGTEYYYAVKCLKKDVVLEDDDVECTLIERKVLTLSTKHPYLCHLFCTFQTQSHLFFVMEYLNGGDLMFHIQQSGRFDEGRARFYAAEIVSGLRFLHKKGIVYRDLKLDNILLDCNGHVRIADFGMCKLQIYLDKTADTFCGTPDYMAPEIIKGMKYNQCVDWWSFGILLYEMVVGQSPFSGCDEDQLFWSICNEQPQYPRFLSTQAKSILVSLLEKESTKRLGSLGCNSGDDVMAHDFFKGLEWGRLERKDLEPPYKPKVFHPLDTHYFDRTFTKEKPRLTPIEKTILESMDQTQFNGFSYTNPNATDC